MNPTMANQGFFSSFDDVWMLDGVRTPMVDYCGALGHISPTDLGIKAAREALKRAGIAATEIGSVITGNMAPGDFDQFFLPRHIGLYAGVPQEVPAIMTQRICGTGFELFRQAGEQIEAGVPSVDSRPGDRDDAGEQNAQEEVPGGAQEARHGHGPGVLDSHHGG